jgi:hypothetical protein
MSPVRRRLLNILTVLSLVLCVAVCVLWVRSYFVADSRGHLWVVTEVQTFDARQWYVGETCGVLWLRTGHMRWMQGSRIDADITDELYTLYRQMEEERHVEPYDYFSSGDQSWVHRRGVSCSLVRPSPPTTGYWLSFSVPHWLVAALLAAPSVRWLYAAARRKRAGTGSLCLRCGYDLRATPERCPECGTEPTPPLARQ